MRRALGGNVYVLVNELRFLVVKTIHKYSFLNLRYASLKLAMLSNFKTPVALSFSEDHLGPSINYARNFTCYVPPPFFACNTQ